MQALAGMVLLSSQRASVLSFAGHTASVTTRLCPQSARAATVGKRIGRGCVPTQLLLWRRRPEFHLISTSHETLFFFVLTSLKV